MVVIVTQNVADRFRGFLASCMLEIAPGVYTAPYMTKGVRDRVWTVVSGWFEETGGSSVVMTWKDGTQPGGQGIQTLGCPPKTMVELDGIPLVKKEINAVK